MWEAIDQVLGWERAHETERSDRGDPANGAAGPNRRAGPSRRTGPNRRTGPGVLNGQRLTVRVDPSGSDRPRQTLLSSSSKVPSSSGNDPATPSRSAGGRYVAEVNLPRSA